MKAELVWEPPGAAGPVTALVQVSRDELATLRYALLLTTEQLQSASAALRTYDEKGRIHKRAYVLRYVSSITPLPKNQAQEEK